ncbi:twin-arginine translocation signal domain-containing protein [candidate division KSB1 bacterium]|nr:twin-arginine translocation signal domain-containing protein [candidate division KSB1 bacterium]
MKKSHELSKEEHRLLGMDRSITRRDFLQGVALGVAGFAIGCRSEKNEHATSQSPYPPDLSGLRGQDEASMKLGHRVRDGEFVQLPSSVIDTGEEYDMKNFSQVLRSPKMHAANSLNFTPRAKII